ncbi:MAG: Bug family tripartite tricarboxylate transporter substrate binding protein, partial [Burkholderiaceae bacterium]
ASAPPLAEGSKFKPQELVAAAMLGDVVVVLAGRPDQPASSIRELVQRLKEAPSKFKYASTGVGTPSHLLMESLIAKMGLSITHIPYNSSPQLLTDLMGGNGGDFALLDPMLAAEQIKSGRLKGIAVTGRKRWSVLPSLPAFAEEFPDLDQQAWMTVSAPAQTPRAILERVNAIVSNAIQKTDLGDELRLKGLEPRSLDVEELNRFISAEIVRWGELVKRFATKS